MRATVPHLCPADFVLRVPPLRSRDSSLSVDNTTPNSEFERDGAVLVVDATSLEFVKGATVSNTQACRQLRVVWLSSTPLF